MKKKLHIFLSVFCASFLLLKNSSTAQVFTENALSMGIDHVYEARDLTGGGAAFLPFDLLPSSTMIVQRTGSPALLKERVNALFTLVSTPCMGSAPHAALVLHLVMSSIVSKSSLQRRSLVGTVEWDRIAASLQWKSAGMMHGAVAWSAREHEHTVVGSSSACA